MRTTTQLSGAVAGATPWVPIDNSLLGFGLTIGCTISSGAVLTYKVQYTHDKIFDTKVCNITRAATVATLKLTDHGLSVNDSIVVMQSGDANLDGTFAVATVVDANTITYTVSNTGLTLASNSSVVSTLRVFDHPTITGKTANSDGNIAFPVTGVRLNLTAWTSGKVSMTLNEGRK
jgi:hypothetical protein